MQNISEMKIIYFWLKFSITYRCYRGILLINICDGKIVAVGEIDSSASVAS